MTVATVSDSSNKKKLAFSLSAGSAFNQSTPIESNESTIIPNSLKSRESRIAALFSFSKNTSRESLPDSPGLLRLSESDERQLSSPSEKSSSIVLDNSSNGLLILSKVENLQLSPIVNLDSSSPSDISSSSVSTTRNISVRQVLNN